MGQRSRGRGIRGAALRAARSALREQDEDAARIAQGVYNVAVAIKGYERTPRWMQGPLQYVAEMAAAAVCKQYGYPPSEAGMMAAYLTEGFLEYAERMVAHFEEGHYSEWRAARGAEGGTDGEGSPATRPRATDGSRDADPTG